MKYTNLEKTNSSEIAGGRLRGAKSEISQGKDKTEGKPLKAQLDKYTQAE